MKATWQTIAVICVLSSLEIFSLSAAEAQTSKAANNPRILAELLMDADEKQFAEIFPMSEKQVEQGLPFLISEINRKPPPDAVEQHAQFLNAGERHAQFLVDEAKRKLAKRQANAAVALLRLDQPAKVWPLLKRSPDPTLRSFVIDRMGPFGADPKVLLARLDDEQDVSVKRAILLSLGQYGPDRFPLAERRNHRGRLLQMYRDDLDPGIHSAAEWLLRQWQASDQIKAFDKELATGKLEGKRQWYLNRKGQMMAVVPQPGEFSMGEKSLRSMRLGRIDRNFAIASKEVTEDQFLQCFKDYKFEEGVTPATTGDCPIRGLTWYDAAAYCNRLSGEEGIPKEQWCYEPNKDGKYFIGMTMPADFLHRTGYRLPTEAEWEYACRAGAESTFSFGNSVELLDKYGWFVRNSRVMGMSQIRPVGSLAPNDLGLFDMHGNAWEWCQNSCLADKNEQGNLTVDERSKRGLSGGSFAHEASHLSVALRSFNFPLASSYAIGFRVARTLPPTPLGQN